MDHDDSGQLKHDLLRWTSTLTRRRALGLIAGASVVPIAGCGDSMLLGDGGLEDSGAGGDGGASGTCVSVPAETAGPYPGDGTNGPNVLTVDGIVRSDIRASIGGASGTAEGVPLTVTLTLLDNGCSPLAGRAIYLWHCDRDGNYSLYGSITDRNYLRGVQLTDANGRVSFTTIFPACYAGRWPHMHFEIYADLASATRGSSALKTSQLAFPEDVCIEAFMETGYEQSVTNLSMVSLASDMIFRDSVDQELATVTGNASSGYAAVLTLTP